jgi:Cu(I)/Ag(I) efflux system periplasmic protein CusF
MKTIRTTALLATLLALAAGPALAQPSHGGGHGGHGGGHGSGHGAHGAQGGGHGAHAAQGAAAASEKVSDFVEVEVRRVDSSRQRVTLRHGDIKELEMPPMTMVFAVAEPAMLEQLKVGEKAQVRIAQRGNTYTVMEVRPAP